MKSFFQKFVASRGPFFQKLYAFRSGRLTSDGVTSVTPVLLTVQCGNSCFRQGHVPPGVRFSKSGNNITNDAGIFWQLNLLN